MRTYGWLLAATAFFLIAGIVLCVSSLFFPAPAQEDLQETTVTIRSLYRSNAPRSHYDYLKTTDGTVYRITGSYHHETLKEQLPEGTTAAVRWYRHVPSGRLFAEEVCVDGVWIVTYNNTTADRVVPLIVGLFSLVMGTGGAFLFRYILRHNREKQRQRDRRIQRKYGDKRVR